MSPKPRSRGTTSPSKPKASRATRPAKRSNTRRDRRPGMVVCLPQGLSLGGVTTWAVRMANGLAARGRPIVLVVHECEGPSIEVKIHRSVRVRRIEGAPPLERCNGDLSAYLPHYRDAIAWVVARTGLPAVLSPNLAGDCYGLAAAVCTLEPESVRVVGWRHNDIEYDARILTHYEPIIERFAGCSDVVAGDLARRMPHRAGDVMSLPYGVETPDRTPVRAPLTGRAVRLLYTGRMEHEQKRVGALLHMGAALDARGIGYELTLVGDGPAAAQVDEACRRLRGARRIAALPPAEVREALAGADLFVMASRYEGLSVSMLEALAHGCPPVVTHVASGAAQAVEHGVSGILLDAAGDDAAVGARMAHAVESVVRASAMDGGARLRHMGAAAWRTAHERFGLDRHLDAVERLIDDVGAAGPRWWPADRPAAFTASGSPGAGEATVPRETPARFREVVRLVAARRGGRARIALWGAGRHTVALAAEIAASPAPIVAVLDDDPAKRGRTIWGLPVVGPEHLPALGVTDAVISSWMHQRAMWMRRGEVESRGVAVHTMHPDPDRTARPAPRGAARRATRAA